MSATMSAPAPSPEVEEPKKKRKLLVPVLLVAILGAAAGAWFFVLKPSPDAGPKPGEVAPLDSIQLNLADGHYLRIGIALQLTEGAAEVDGSKALDATIEVFSGHTVGEVNQPETREKLRDQLEDKLEERYDGEVMAVYFKEFVTQ